METFMHRALSRRCHKPLKALCESLEQRRMLSLTGAIFAKPADVTVIGIVYVPPPPPVAGAVSSVTQRNQQDVINVLANDSATAPAVLIPADVQVVIAPSHGTAVPESDGSILYAPTAGYVGSDSFTYTVKDNNQNVSLPGLVSITINAPPPPTAGDVAATTASSTPVTINVLSSDLAVAPATLVPADVQIARVPSHGTAVPQSNGSILYTPTIGYSGGDSFTYTVQDTNADVSAPGTVSISISPTLPPVAGPVSDATYANSPLTINVLASDSATAPATLVPADVLVVTAPSHGLAIPQPDGTILYTPTTGYSGPDTFTYTVADTNGQVSVPGTVSLTINLRTPPVAGAVTATTRAGQAVTINVLSSDSATLPATLIPADVLVATPPSHGTAVPQSDGSILYTPATNYSGSDNFTYTVQDINGTVSAPGTVTITITPPTPPTAGPVTASTTASAPVTINVLASDSATAGALNPGSVTVASPPTHGSAVAQADGSILYTPAAQYTGNDTFTYTVADSLGDVSPPATVTITVTPGVPPVVPPITAPIVGGQTNTINVISTITGGAPLVPSSVTIVTPPTGGTASVNTSTGEISYLPSPGFVGTDTFTYTVANVVGATSAPATVSVNVGTTISSTSGAPHSLTFTNALGGAETITLNKGSTELFFSGSSGSVTVGKKGNAVVTGTNLELAGITLSGTTAASVLSLRGPAKAPVTIGGITDSSPLGSIIAPQGALSGTVTVSGLSVLNVASINNSAITIGAGGAPRFSLTAGPITSTTLDCAVPITSLRAASWSGLVNGARCYIKAPSIASLSIAGAFNADLTLTANGKSFALNNARITGAVGATTWTIPGAINAITAGSIAAGWKGTFGKINSMTIRAGGLSNAVLTAGAVGSLTITGDVTSSNITAGSTRLLRFNGSIRKSSLDITGTIGQLVATGSLINDAIFTGGNLNTLTAAAMSSTNLDIGVSTTVTLATANTANLGSASLGRVRLTGRAGDQFTNSQILAGKITTASLGIVTTANGGVSLGIASKSVGTFTGTIGHSLVRPPRSALASTATLTAYLLQKNISFGDLEILIPG
jgi:hypothetical protein